MTFTYPEVGATAGPGPLPAGYHHLHHRTAVGHGPADFAAAGLAVTTWRMHRAARVLIDADGPRAVPGTRVTCGIGFGPARITAPCEVVRAVDEPRRTGFAYGTLAGHPECGEEAFVVELGADGTVWFTVTAFSRPATRPTRLAGPLVPLFQRLYARHCGRTLRRLTARGGPPGPR
ncbi:DUF1990 family protein [Kitasatospora sp. DSM 101779]|uniref:DUF1990 family protein n=1 Tax=Kitasatospora sp. DSM 101779 TaxID=2853165 RepID=UPI0021DA6EA4|nr:DUF1990 domain-containing protein [Kitasatospora sp. DSM 101779]MCU7825589.1 DUF1990 domain-containing protein [Kitasatospora sp. DSM 101779]